MRKYGLVNRFARKLKHLFMILSEKVQKVLDYVQDITVPDGLPSWEVGRAFYKKFIPLAGEKIDLYKIEDYSIPNDGSKIKLRTYYPNQKSDLPVIIYFHGGWFNSGSLETHDTPLRDFSHLSQSVIISIDYRLAPEFPFPAGLDDCETAVNWVIENASLLNINLNNLIIMGDSAGGALATTITRKFRHVVKSQLLIYPVTDNSLETSSWIDFKDGPLLDLKGGKQAWDWYLNENDYNNPDAIPLLANDLEGLPPTFIAVAEYDPLKDEAIQYAEKLKGNNIDLELKIYNGMIHGFLQMGGVIDDTKTLMENMVLFINKKHSSI